jgi:hypothetical protein
MDESKMTHHLYCCSTQIKHKRKKERKKNASRHETVLSPFIAAA